MVMQSSVGFGLVHGGLHGGWCWDLLRPHLNGPNIAVDLPGRAGTEANLAKITYEDWVEAAANQIAKLEAPDIVLVGHSLAGITLPQTAIRLGARVKGIIFFASVIPNEGETFEGHMGKTINGGAWEIAPLEISRIMLGTGMADEMFDTLFGRLNPEPALPLKTPISRKGVPNIPSLYICAKEDATRLGKAEADRLRADFPDIGLAEVPGGHNMMMTHPEILASAINDFASGLKPQT